MAEVLDAHLLLLDARDNVLVVRRAVPVGQLLDLGSVQMAAERALPLGHKVARAPISSGAAVIKYGAPIGRATRDIEPGEHVHLHNLASDYTPTHTIPTAEEGR